VRYRNESWIFGSSLFCRLGFYSPPILASRNVRHSPFAGPRLPGFAVRVWSFIRSALRVASHGPQHHPDAKLKSIPNFVPSAPLW